eukprot:749242-Hanusia_phi.AAC.9
MTPWSTRRQQNIGANQLDSSSSRTQDQGGQSQSKRKMQSSEEIASTSTSSLLNNKRMKQTPGESESRMNASVTAEQRSKFFASKDGQRGSKTPLDVVELLHEGCCEMQQEHEKDACCRYGNRTFKHESTDDGFSCNKVVEHRTNSSNNSQQHQRKRKAQTAESTTRRVTRKQDSTSSKADKNLSNDSLLLSGHMAKSDLKMDEDPTQLGPLGSGEESYTSSTSRRVPNYVSRRFNPI